MESLPSLPDGSALPHRLSNFLHARHSRTLLLHRFHLSDYYASNRLRLHRQGRAHSTPASPLAGRATRPVQPQTSTRTMRALTLHTGPTPRRSHTNTRLFNAAPQHGLTVIQQSNQLRFHRSRKPGVPNASHTGPDQRKSHTGTRSFNAAPQRGITVHSTIKSATVPQRQARRA